MAVRSPSSILSNSSMAHTPLSASTSAPPSSTSSLVVWAPRRGRGTDCQTDAMCTCDTAHARQAEGAAPQPDPVTPCSHTLLSRPALMPARPPPLGCSFSGKMALAPVPRSYVPRDTLRSLRSYPPLTGLRITAAVRPTPEEPLPVVYTARGMTRDTYLCRGRDGWGGLVEGWRGRGGSERQEGPRQEGPSLQQNPPPRLVLLRSASSPHPAPWPSPRGSPPLRCLT
jgi:hypothetical protein